jgi:hypothetical protein
MILMQLKDIERVPTPSTIRSFSTDVDEDKVGVSKPEGKNGNLSLIPNSRHFLYRSSYLVVPYLQQSIAFEVHSLNIFWESTGNLSNHCMLTLIK